MKSCRRSASSCRTGHVTAAITKDAAEDLGFAVGDDVVVVIKATEVMLAKE